MDEVRNESQQHYAQNSQNADQSISQVFILLPLEIDEDDHSDDNNHEEHCNHHDVCIAAIFAHPLHEDRTTIFACIRMRKVKLVFAFFTFD